MKKLIITILFLYSFCLTAQIQLSEDWSFKPDKVKHVLIGGSLSASSNVIISLLTADAEFGRRAGIHTVVYVSLAWEILWALSGKEISFADMSYATVAAIGAGYLTTWFIKKILKMRYKNLITIEQTMITEDISYSLDNPIFINNESSNRNSNSGS